MPHLRAADVTFLQLRHTVFCVQCELISYNNGSKCLACGSTALLALSQVLGGSLQQQEGARLIQDERIHHAIHNMLEPKSYGPTLVSQQHESVEKTLAARSAAGVVAQTLPESLPQFQPAMRWVVERASTLTLADGAALALAREGKLICHAHAGPVAPDLGMEIEPHRGISGLCARTGIAWRCDSAESDARVDRLRCRELGAQSVIAAPVAHLNTVIGVLEVFSRQQRAFSDHDVATMQLLAGLMLVAVTRGKTAALPSIGGVA